MRFKRLATVAAACVASLCGALGMVATAQAEPPIKIGQSVVLSGPQAANGLLYSQGIKVHLDAINAAGGVGGRKIELITLDDGYDPARCKANTKQLLEQDKVIALFGYTGSPAIMACAPMAEAAKVPMISPVSGTPELQEHAGRYLFFTRASFRDELRAMIDYLTTTGITSYGVTLQDDSFGHSALKIVEELLAERKLPPPVSAPVAQQTYEAGASAAAISKVAPQAVILATGGKASVNFIRDYLKTGKRAQFLGLSVVSSNQLVQELGKDADGIIVTQVVPSPWAKKTQIVRDFYRELGERKDVEINYFTLEGYIAARVLVEAVRRAGPEVSPERLVQALESMRKLNLGGYEVNFGPGVRAGSSYVDLSMVRSDGRYVQ
ncbi:ABC transporter substrate-binding protein [Azoarcus sp. TTM-91]|uniref:ABC transporter substrate-binding protein n=1 Tax=Azoarcus sp. TTM-91 TaxID=2691581 RepID=UPI00145F2C8E|nr:ABC transporter substrate-binding protein [Azoarcus sp. TTM-91]NMG34278.1 ABC transporter substrate-binding protein [Azoarcus sp. TTM-91]